MFFQTVTIVLLFKSKKKKKHTKQKSSSVTLLRQSKTIVVQVVDSQETIQRAPYSFGLSPLGCLLVTLLDS